MSKAEKWAEENKKLSDKEPRKFVCPELTAMVLTDGDLRMLHDGRLFDVSFDTATFFARWMRKNYLEETSDFPDENHLRQEASNLSEDV